MRFFIAIALLVAVTPGMTEVAETIAHVIAHGDLPHHQDARMAAADAHGEGMSGDEHTCTALFHACGCHSAASAVMAAMSWHARPIDASSSTILLSLIAVVGLVGEPPPLRPPIA